MSAKEIKEALSSVANPAKAAHSVRFFKAGKGEYGDGDKFLGITVPEQRRIAKGYKDLAFTEIAKLVRSQYHEHRLTGFFVLLHRYKRGDGTGKAEAFAFCRKHLARLNNWDLVDTVAPNLIGDFIRTHSEHKPLLYTWAASADLWERRIAMIATRAFIVEREYEDALAIARILVDDDHDLIHKAVGWMLREIGNRDLPVERAFLDEHAATMPRTMLRYAIEKFTPAQRKHYMTR